MRAIEVAGLAAIVIVSCHDPDMNGPSGALASTSHGTNPTTHGSSPSDATLEVGTFTWTGPSPEELAARARREEDERRERERVIEEERRRQDELRRSQVEAAARAEEERERQRVESEKKRQRELMQGLAKGRVIGSVSASNPCMDILVRDHSGVDGDRVRLTFNGHEIESNVTLTRTAQSYRVDLPFGPSVVTAEALNEGSSPPNTAEMTVKPCTGAEQTFRWNMKTGDLSSVTVERH